MTTSHQPSVVPIPSRNTPPRASVQIAIVIGAAMAAVSLVWMAHTSPDVEASGLLAALACWVTIPYLLAGLIAWRQRPASNLGRLMVAAGFVTWTNFLIWSGNDLLYTVGLVGDFLPPVLFLHVFLTFPSGRLDDPYARFVVIAAYLATGLTLARLGLGEGAPRNLLAVTEQLDIANLLIGIQLIMLAILSLAGIAVLIRRRVENGRRLRAAASYLVDSFAVGLLMIAVLMVGGLLEASWTQPVRLATFLMIGIAPIVFLAGLLQARLGRTAVAEMIVELGTSPDHEQLVVAASRALRDPSVDLIYWLPEFDSYANAEGRQVENDELASRAAWAVTVNALPVALLLHDPEIKDEVELLSSVAAAVGMAIENARLQVELKARLEELKGSRARIVEAETSERRRLERDLHDGAQQRLVALSLELSLIQEGLQGNPEMRTRAGVAIDEVNASLAELRSLAQGIHPAVVSDHGLSVAVESLATRASIPIVVEDRLTVRPPEPVEVAAFFVVSESLANVAKHARATEATVTLVEAGDQLIVEIRDDGVGGASTLAGTGLRGLADRVEAFGGRLAVWSPAGGGTRVRAEIPCER